MDSNPLAAIVARSKLIRIDVETVLKRARELLAEKNNPPVPEGMFWELCFSPRVLESLCIFRARFERGLENDADIMLCALICGMLHGPGGEGTNLYLSNKMPSSFSPPPEALTDYWIHNRLRPPDIDIYDILSQRSRYLLNTLPASVPGKVKLADSRDQRSYAYDTYFNRVTTSPPYYGLDSYHADQWLRLWLLGIPSDPGGNINHYDENVYVHDLAAVWKNCASVCCDGAKLAIRFGNVHGHENVPAHELLEASFALANAGWIMDGKRPVKTESTSTAQSVPFPPPTPRPISEYEFFFHVEK